MRSEDQLNDIDESGSTKNSEKQGEIPHSNAEFFIYSLSSQSPSRKIVL